MTPEEAIARMRARWTHAPIDVVDVEERLALRLADRPELEARMVLARDACRVFVRRVGAEWRSRYVHAVEEVDAAIGWILGQLEELEREAQKRARRKAERAARAATAEAA